MIPTLDRRAFVNYLTGIGLGTTLLPGALWARLQQQQEDRITKEMIKDAEALAGLEFTDAELGHRALIAVLQRQHDAFDELGPGVRVLEQRPGCHEVRLQQRAAAGGQPELPHRVAYYRADELNVVVWDVAQDHPSRMRGEAHVLILAGARVRALVSAHGFEAERTGR